MFFKSKSFKFFSRSIQITAIGFLIFTGCSGNRYVTKRGQLEIPAGVDSTVAAQADSIADRLFVSIDREQRAEKYKDLGKEKSAESDTVWQYLSQEMDSTFQADTLKAVEAFNKGARNLQDLAALQSRTDLAPEVQKAEALRLLEQARLHFEQAVSLNPFDSETRSWLARVYQTLASRFLDEENNKRAVKVLESLVRLEQGEHALFARLAESYYALEDWQNANRNFTKAETVLREAAGLDFSKPELTEDAAIDTASLFYYVYYQGDTEIKMHQAEAGLASLNRALQVASTQQERDDIHSYIEWINWDDGNTRGVEKRDKYIALQEEGNYKDAAKGFEKLIPELQTRRAIDETVWRLAVIEFQYLDKKDQGIDRLKHVIKLTPKDESGAPADTTYNRYFNSYGVMCHNLGLEHYNQNRKFAFMYFQQAVTVDWENRAKSYLEIAKLSRNNPKAVIESAKQALTAPEQLDAQEQMQAYQLLVEGLKRSGRFDEARAYYAQWIDLRRNNSRGSN